MANPGDELRAVESGWQPKQVYGMAGACLALGLIVGYLLRGSEPSAARPVSTASLPQAMAVTSSPQMPTLAQMKHMADKKAEPLLLKLKSDPNNPDLLMQVGNIYKSTHQFKEAVSYYQRSLEVKPGNVAARNEMASCLYYEGDVDGALMQLEHALKSDPGNANSLFNLGLIRWKGKNDAAGAVAVWQKLLKSNPDLAANKKAEVKNAIASAQRESK
jgi:cytochrome c-type biogenesis protein CcmH/NrfG